MKEYKKPAPLLKVMNWFLGLAIKSGLSPQGSQLFTVRGRKTGKPMTTPVNPLTFNGAEYLVSPRGNTHWSRNLRAAGTGELRLGRKKRPIRVVHELSDEEKPPVLLAYLERWSGVTAKQFGIQWPDPPEAEVTRVSARTPMFRIENA